MKLKCTSSSSTSSWTYRKCHFCLVINFHKSSIRHKWLYIWMPIIKIFLFLPLFSRISFFNLKNVEFYSIFKFGKSLNRWWIEQRMRNNSLLNSSQVKKKRKSSKKKWRNEKKTKIHALNNDNSYEIGTYLCVCVCVCMLVWVCVILPANKWPSFCFSFFFLVQSIHLLDHHRLSNHRHRHHHHLRFFFFRSFFKVVIIFVIYQPFMIVRKRRRQKKNI